MSSFFSLIKKNQNGFSLVEIMIATGMLTIAGLAVMGLSQLTNQDSLQLKAIRVALTGRAAIEAALKNPASWRQSVAQNTSFACVSTPPGCANSGYYDFVLYGTGVGEKVTFDPADGTTRLAIQGGKCPTGTADPNPQCPIKFMARWKPLCQTYPCLNPTLDIKVSLVPEFGTNAPPFNPQKYEFATVRGIDDGSIQSACQILNGTYNVATGTCYPKNAGKSCASLGKPAQIVSSVASDGSITCAPLYSGQCNPVMQVINGISSSATAQCAVKVQPGNCPMPCVGSWGTCSAACGGGTQVYSIATAAVNGGAACPFANGASQTCNTSACPVNCVGGWSGCSVTCGGGTMTYSIVTAAANGGSNCPNNPGDSVGCNSQACAINADCAGSWSACNTITGTKIFTVTQAQQGSGAACPAQLTQSCAVDCVGGWGACAGGPPQFKTYKWTTLPLNGGSVTACNYPDGQTDSLACTILVNGLCGSASGVPASAAPAANLCSTGSADPVSGSGPWAWNCLGSGGGTNSSCSASVAVGPINGVCGSASGVPASAAPAANLCSTGSADPVSGTGPWAWTCFGSGGGTNSSCSASVASASAVAVNGVCGSASGSSASAAPTANLCSTGSADTASGTGPWAWNCFGSGGGTDSSCTASVAAVAVNGVCGSASGSSASAAPAANLCTTGSADTVSGTGPWAWKCLGSGGGTDSSWCNASVAATCRWENFGHYGNNWCDPSVTTGDPETTSAKSCTNANNMEITPGGDAGTAGYCNTNFKCVCP